MKKQQVIKPFPKNGKKTTKWNDVFINAVAIVLIGGVLIWMGINIYQQGKHDYEVAETIKGSLPQVGEAIPHNLVCMASNRYSGNEQILVTVNGSAYYGCQTGVRDLNTHVDMRFAVDPFNKKPVDKALAFIYLNPNKTGAILYFESKENAKKIL